MKIGIKEKLDTAKRKKTKASGEKREITYHGGERFWEEHTSKGSTARGIRMVVVLLLGALTISLASMFMGAAEYLPDMFLEYFARPSVVLLNLLPSALILFLLYFIINRAGWSFLITYVFVAGLSVIDYYKIKLRDDPLIFSDIDLISEAADISGRYTITISWPVVVVILIGILCTFLMFRFAKTRFRRGKLNLAALAVVIAAGALLYPFVYLNNDVYAETGESKVVGQWSDKEKYVSRGFLYPLLYSSKQYFNIPDGSYDAEEAEKQLMEYTYDDIPSDQKVAVFSIMCEAFNDFSKFDTVEFERDPYAAYHELEKNSLHGHLITNIFGGGTVNTERAFLTGFTDFNTFTKDTNSYVRYFKEQGYYTEGGHPGTEWYYDRDKINKYFGFDNYYYFENRYQTETGFYLGDDEFFSDIRTLYEDFRATSNQPYFSFSVTYQNHGPYSEVHQWYSHEYIKNTKVDGKAKYSKKAERILNNYFSVLENTADNIAGMADYLDTLNEPAVLIVFGDHNPWLGDNEYVYEELGVDVKRESSDGFLNYYETSYLIYANQAAKTLLNNPFVGAGGDFSPGFLMQRFFQAAGWGGNEYMKLTKDMKKISPLVHQGGFFKEGKDVVASLENQEDRDFFQAFSNMQYYWRNNFRAKDAMEDAVRAGIDKIYKDGAALGEKEKTNEGTSFKGSTSDGGTSTSSGSSSGSTTGSTGRWRSSGSSGGSGRSGSSGGSSGGSSSGGDSSTSGGGTSGDSGGTSGDSGGSGGDSGDSGGSGGDSGGTSGDSGGTSGDSGGSGGDSGSGSDSGGSGGGSGGESGGGSGGSSGGSSGGESGGGSGGSSGGSSGGESGGSSAE